MSKIKSEIARLEEKVVTQIKRYAANNGENNSVASISRRCLIPQSTLNHKMNNPRTFTIENLFFIANGLGIDVEDIFKEYPN